MPLTAKQRRFVEEYLIDLNGAQAAIRAGYSAKTARQQASENLSKPDIAEAIAAAQQERSQRTEITQDRVIAELATIAFADARDYLAWGGTKVMLKASPDLESAAAVASVSGDGEKATLKLHDKIRALELLGRHVGMFTKRVEVSGELGLGELFEQVRARARERQAAEAADAESE
jgi:phage terminase small subunit